MRIRVIVPTAPTNRGGNRVTAERWAGILRGIGHDVTVSSQYRGAPCDLMIALHARKSRPAMAAFRERYPDNPLVVALTGTDLYGDLGSDVESQESIREASRVILLQPYGMNPLPPPVRRKARVIHQSATRVSGDIHPRPGVFQVCVLSHLRDVKDPFRTAMAARLLPPESTIQVVHLGAAWSEVMEQQARQEMEINPRYRWLGSQPRGRALRTLAQSQVLVLTSKSEGGANVVSEAIAARVPVISSRIPGSVGLLGDDYPGYFPVGDTEALCGLLGRAEVEQDFYNRLRARSLHLESLVDPKREEQSWRALLAELT